MPWSKETEAWMDPNIAIESRIRLEHQHDDGNWYPMRPHNDPADHDPERGWVRHTRFKCTACGAIFRVLPDDEGGLQDEDAR
jgi:hypothetical protein